MKRRDFTRSFGRAYDGPRMRNPFFAAPVVSKAVKYLVMTAIGGVIVGVPLVLVYAPFMQYDTVQVNGLTTLSIDEVTAMVNTDLNHRRMLVIPGSHLFFANTETIAENLDTQFHFETLTLRREGRALVIDTQERITEIAWTVADKTYFVDLMGIAAREATPEALVMIAARRAHSAEIPIAPGVQPVMPIVDIREGDEVVLGTVVIPVERLANILALDRELRARSFSPITYTLDASDTPWLTVSLLEQPSLLVDVTTSPDNPLAMLDAFSRDRNGDLSVLLYIDLRFGNHVYSKNK